MGGTFVNLRRFVVPVSGSTVRSGGTLARLVGTISRQPYVVLGDRLAALQRRVPVDQLPGPSRRPFSGFI